MAFPAIPYKHIYCIALITQHTVPCRAINPAHKSYIIAGILQLVEQIVDYVTTMVSMNKPQRIQASSFLVRRARGSVFRQISSHKLQSLLLMTLWGGNG